MSWFFMHLGWNSKYEVFFYSDEEQQKQYCSCKSQFWWWFYFDCGGSRGSGSRTLEVLVSVKVMIVVVVAVAVTTGRALIKMNCILRCTIFLHLHGILSYRCVNFLLFSMSCHEEDFMLLAMIGTVMTVMMIGIRTVYISISNQSCYSGSYTKSTVVWI